MKLLPGLFLISTLLAQDKPADQPPAAPPAATAPAPPDAPPPESAITGSIELGYRFIPNISGSFDTYRSVVNLGEGPKLIGADFTIHDPKHRVFDRLDIHASAWGDPYNTLRVDLLRERYYRLTVDYKNIAYYNFLPSFADPSLTQGIQLDVNSFDSRIRSLDVQLDLLPGRWITPFLAFGRNSQDGRGITSFTSDFNEYGVASLYSDSTDTYRGGVRIDLSKYHLTIEQGGTTFKDDEGASDVQPNPGVLPATFLGPTLSLSNLNELYRVRGDSFFTRGLFSANPVSWANFSGGFIYSRPRTNTTYTSSANGTLYYAALGQFYSSGQDLLTSDATMPHSSGSLNAEFRLSKRLRILEYFMIDREHNASNALLMENLLIGGQPLTNAQISSDRLVLNYSQQEFDLLYDVSSTLTIRGGYRYLWGDATVRAPQLLATPFESSRLSHQIGTGGFTWRPSSKVRINGNAEGGSSPQDYFRTSLHDYVTARLRGTYDFSSSLRFGADFGILKNSDPEAGVNLDLASKTATGTLSWTPKNSKLFSALADYSYSSVRSSILYLVPQTLTEAPSIYTESGHTGTLLASIKWFSAGGSFFHSTGSRPVVYYQPLIRVSVPVTPHITLKGEYRYYGFNERSYSFENFSSNQVLGSIRFSL